MARGSTVSCWAVGGKVGGPAEGRGGPYWAVVGTQEGNSVVAPAASLWPAAAR
jgi:hypothetical protein